MARLSNFSDIINSTKFANVVNGPISLGLAMAEEKGLGDNDKLGVIGYKDLLNAGFEFNIQGAATGSDRHRLSKVKQMHAILLSTHNVAIKEKLNGVLYSSVGSDQLPGALKVACAYALQAYGFIGWFAVKNDGGNKCRTYMSEYDTIPAADHDAWSYSDTPASDFRVLSKTEVAEIAKKLTVDSDGEVPELAYLQSYVGNDCVARALSVCLATKINYFQTNHHTGQGEMTSFIRKVLSTLYPTQFKEADINQLKDAAHTVGHWMSTHIGLNSLGMVTGKPVAISPVAALMGQAATNLASDFVARADSLPAGTAPYAVVHATLKEFSTNKAFTVAPYAKEMAEAAQLIQDLLDEAKTARTNRTVDPRLAYHMDAAYLTGSQRKTYTTPAPIGTVGSFLFNLKASSSLTSSPLISKYDPATKTRGKAYEGAFGFDERWESFCAGLRGVRGKMCRKAQEAMGSVSAGGTIPLADFIALNKFAPASKDAAEAIHAETDKILKGVDDEDDDDVEMGLPTERKRRRT
jgi:hypothetical protein